MTSDELKSGVIVRVMAIGLIGKVTCRCMNNTKAKVGDGKCFTIDELELFGDVTQDYGPNRFVVGAKVTIRSDSRFFGQSKSPGKIIRNASSRGWVTVKFDDGNVNSYRIGFPDVEGGACDLELIFEDPRIVFFENLLQGISRPAKSMTLDIKSADLKKIRAETEVEVTKNEIKIKTPQGVIIFNLESGLYSVIKTDGVEIPFYEICRGPAKAGISQFIGHQQFYPAYAIISKWLKGGAR